MGNYLVLMHPNSSNSKSEDTCGEQVDWYEGVDLPCQLPKGHEGEHYAVVIGQSEPPQYTSLDFKKYFEANLLDGEDVYDCGETMLRADYVYEVIAEYVSEQQAKLLQVIEDELNKFTARHDEPMKEAAIEIIKQIKERYE